MDHNTPTKKTQKLSVTTNQIIFEFLQSPERDFGFKYYQKEHNLNLPETKRQIKNRIDYLKNLQKDKPRKFSLLCQEFERLNTTSSDSSSKRHTEPEEYFEENATPTFVTSESTTFETTDTMTTANELGELIMLYFECGLIFVNYWVDSNLSGLELNIRDDGLGVVLKSKRPIAKQAYDVIPNYSWANDPKNFVVKGLETELEKLNHKFKKEASKEKVICEFKEKVSLSFYDVNGEKTNDVMHRQDNEGRQSISFFVKTVRSIKDTPTAGVFVSNDFSPENDQDMDDSGSEAAELKKQVAFLSNMVKNLTEKMEGASLGEPELPRKVAKKNDGDKSVSGATIPDVVYSSNSS